MGQVIIMLCCIYIYIFVCMYIYMYIYIYILLRYIPFLAALQMLHQQSQSRGAPETLRGVERTVDYLQRLNKTHIDIILESAAWVIRSDPDKGLSVSCVHSHTQKLCMLYFLQSSLVMMCVPSLIQFRV